MKRVVKLLSILVVLLAMPIWVQADEVVFSSTSSYDENRFNVAVLSEIRLARHLNPDDTIYFKNGEIVDERQTRTDDGSTYCQITNADFSQVLVIPPASYSLYGDTFINTYSGPITVSMTFRHEGKLARLKCFAAEKSSLSLLEINNILPSRLIQLVDNGELNSQSSALDQEIRQLLELIQTEREHLNRTQDVEALQRLRDRLDRVLNSARESTSRKSIDQNHKKIFSTQDR